jgi:hypothetical protein
VNRRRARAAGLAVIAVALVAGCDQDAGAPAPESRVAREAAAPRADSSASPIGTWTVTGHYMPGISAIGEDEAKARHGQTVELSATAAVSSNDRCDAPSFASRTVPADEYLATEYRLAPGSLQPLADLEELRLIEVACNGAPWVGFGALLIEVDSDRVLTPWDGVFFELERLR